MNLDEPEHFLSAPAAASISPPAADDIFALPRLKPDVTGVYFLFKGEECVYVGKSRRVHLRVSEHMRGDFRFKDFDSYTWLACSEAEAASLEVHYIMLFKPRLNITWTGVAFSRKPKPEPIEPQPGVVDLDAEIAKAKDLGQCPLNIKKLVKARMEENRNNYSPLPRRRKVRQSNPSWGQ